MLGRKIVRVKYSGGALTDIGFRRNVGQEEDDTHERIGAVKEAANKTGDDRHPSQRCAPDCTFRNQCLHRLT